MAVSSGGTSTGFKEKFVDYGETTKRQLRIIMSRANFSFAGSSLKKLRISEGMVSIPQNAFKGCTNITSIGPVGSGADVEIPNSVTSIGMSAFQGCTGLTSVTLPNAITTIGSSAFQGCTGLTSVTIPENVSQIPYKAFGDCTNLQQVTILGNPKINRQAFENSTENLPSEGNIIYMGTTAYALADTESTQTTYTFKQGTTTLNNYLFNNNTYVTTVTMPNSLLTIGDNCFNGCTNLTDVTLNNGLIEIGANAFNNCTSLVGLTLPNTLTTLGQQAFGNCSGLTEMVVPDSVTGRLSQTFLKCTNLTNLTIGDGVTGLSFLFETNGRPSSYSIQNLVLGKNITEIYHLWGLDGWQSHKTITNITINCDCTWYQTYLEATNLKIGKNFPNINNLTNSMQAILTIGDESNLSVDPQNPHYIAYDDCLITTDTNTLVFARQGKSHYLSSQNTIKVIGVGYRIFNNGQKYNYGFRLPESVTTINDYAFENSYLNSLTIPSNVTSIGNYALRNAVNAYFNNAYSGYNGLEFTSLVPPTITQYALDCDNDNKFKITVPAAAYNTYKNAWSQYRTRIVPDDYSQLQEQWVDLYECCVNGELHMKQKRQLSSDGVTWYDSYKYVNNNWEIETRHNETVLGECTPNLDIEIGNFQTSTSYGNLSDNSADYDFYETTLQSNQQGTVWMKIRLYGYQSFTFKIRVNSGYIYYNYLYVNKLDVSSLINFTYGGTPANVYAYTSTSSTSEWQDVTFTNLDGGEHTITIALHKGSGSYTGDGYVAIPKVQP